jgi:FkbM family methyltransferase
MHPTIHHANWFAHNCNNTIAVNYNLTKDSLVIDLGAFKGIWSEQMIDLYDCKMILYEPVEKFFNILESKFYNNKKISIFNFGIHPIKKEEKFYINGDGSSAHVKKGEEIKITYKNLIEHLDSLEVQHVDLMQINIEGDEYDLLEDLIKSSKIEMFDNLQIQFHDFVSNADLRRERIRNSLLKIGWNLKWEYPWVFESWSKK